MNITAAYAAGFDTVPPDLEQACPEWPKVGYELNVDGDRPAGVTKIRAGDTEKQFSTSDGLTTDLGRAGLIAMPTAVYALLAPYRRVVPC